MEARPYWSERQGRGPIALPTLDDLRRAVRFLVQNAVSKYYLQEWFGYECVDAGDVFGLCGGDPAVYVELQLGRPGIWPISQAGLDLLDEDGLFDLIEFLHRHVSSPVDGNYHSWNSCGWHYTSFDPLPAQLYVRETINRLLRNYGTGFELSVDGEIQRGAADGLDDLLTAAVPAEDPMLVGPLHEAIRKYRSRGGGPSDRRDAVRDLFDILERLRPQVKQHLMTQDEKDLFMIANKFGIRHHNAAQQGDYDGETWWSWMFYVNLATIHLLLRKIERDASP